MGLREWELRFYISGGSDLRRTEDGNRLVEWVHVDSAQCEFNAGPVFARALREQGTIVEEYR